MKKKVRRYINDDLKISSDNYDGKEDSDEEDNIINLFKNIGVGK